MGCRQDIHKVSEFACLVIEISRSSVTSRICMRPELDLDLNKQTWGLFTYNGSVSSRKAQLLYIETSPFSSPIRDGFAKNHPSKKNPLNRFHFLCWLLPTEMEELIPFCNICIFISLLKSKQALVYTTTNKAWFSTCNS